MTIPEPTDDALEVDLHDLYDAVYTGLRLGEMSVRKLISRAYHAERLVDQLRARVAELEVRLPRTPTVQEIEAKIRNYTL